DDALAERLLPEVEAQPRLPLVLVRAVAGEAVLGEERPDVAIVLNRAFAGLRGGSGLRLLFRRREPRQRGQPDQPPEHRRSKPKPRPRAPASAARCFYTFHPVIPIPAGFRRPSSLSAKAHCTTTRPHSANDAGTCPEFRHLCYSRLPVPTDRLPTAPPCGARCSLRGLYSPRRHERRTEIHR